jgi:hypothetical protein
MSENRDLSEVRLIEEVDISRDLLKFNRSEDQLYTFKQTEEVKTPQKILQEEAMVMQQYDNVLQQMNI